MKDQTWGRRSVSTPLVVYCEPGRRLDTSGLVGTPLSLIGLENNLHGEGTRPLKGRITDASGADTVTTLRLRGLLSILRSCDRSRYS